MKVQIGDRYIGKRVGGKIKTVTKVLIAEDAKGDFYEYAIFDNDESHLVPVGFIETLMAKIVQSRSAESDVDNAEPTREPFAAVKNEYPAVKWIAKSERSTIDVYFKKPCLSTFGSWDGDFHYLRPAFFPEVYAYFANIPWNESLTAL